MATIAHNWESFVNDWCLGVPPTAGHDYAVRAFEALERHLPEYLTRTLGSGAKGIGVMFWPLEIGNVLAETEMLEGFAPVVARVRDGERGAMSELRFATKLKHAGLIPWLEAEVGGKKLDIGVRVGEIAVYMEVVTPDRSDSDKDAHLRVMRARDRLGESDGLQSVVELLTFPTDEVVDSVAAAMRDAPLGQWCEIPGVARWRRDEHPTGGRSGEFKWPANEHRAHRLISAEYDHFAAEVPYVLVADTNATLLSPEGWTAAFAECFKPSRNRKLGATVAYREYSLEVANPQRTFACVYANPYAYRPVPAELIRVLMGLNQPIDMAAT